MNLKIKSCNVPGSMLSVHNNFSSLPCFSYLLFVLSSMSSFKSLYVIKTISLFSSNINEKPSFKLILEYVEDDRILFMQMLGRNSLCLLLSFLPVKRFDCIKVGARVRGVSLSRHQVFRAQLIFTSNIKLSLTLIKL